MTQTIIYKNYKIFITPDDYPPNPRKDFDPLGLLVCNHRRYNLGEMYVYDQDLYDSAREAIEADENYGLVMTVYMYEHGNVALNLTGFGCKWDSGAIGFYALTKKELAEFPTCEAAIQAMKAELEAYTHYINGNCWVRTIIDPEGKEIDCVGGFLGDNDYPIQEGKAFIDRVIKHEKTIINFQI